MTMAQPARVFATLTMALSVLATACSAPAAEDSKVVAASAEEKAHPLDAELATAKKRLATMEKEIKDYSFTLMKRERVGGTLLDYEAMHTKVRHNPFSVYMYFLQPEAKKGQQVVYIAGRNNGNLIAQPVGLAGNLGPFSLPPTGFLAMQGQRYPITELGFVNLTRRLMEVGELDRKHGEVQVKHYKNVKLKGGSGDPRICTMTEVIHPVERDYFRFHKARIYVDDELNVPIRFESYLWPAKPGDPPVLLEEYTYLDLKLNNGFTDADFQIRK